MRSVRSKLFAAIGLAVLVSIVLTLLVGAYLTRRSIERAALTALGRQADLLAVREESQPIPEPQLRALQRFLIRQRVLLAVLPRPVTDPLIPSDIRAAVDGGQAVTGTTVVRGNQVLFAVAPAGNQAVLLTRKAHLGASDWQPFVGSFVVAGLVGAGLAGLASFLLARAIARPVRRAAGASRLLAAGADPGPLPVEGADELAVLSSSFNEMAAQLTRARETEQSFLLSVSHELKTPLTAIRGYAEALEEGAVEGPEAGEVIVRESARLERLVQDVLDLARMRQATFTVRREPVDLADIAAEAVRRWEPRARSFGVELVPATPGPAPSWGDPDRMLQVTSNLVENALRSTPAGGRVTVAVAPGLLAVGDTGPGLSAEDLPRAFERFFLYRRYAGERPVGTGLGLALVKELTEAMGGSVSVSSEPGRGATFTVRLPVSAPTPPRPG